MMMMIIIIIILIITVNIYYRLQAGWSVALWITVAKLLVAVRGQRPTDQEIAQEGTLSDSQTDKTLFSHDKITSHKI